MSQPYAEVIGDPIAHSKSPLIHNFWLGKLGIDADYRACHMRAEELADYFARKRGDAEWRGCNITVPHKEAATHFIDSLLPGYQDIGAINLAICRGGALLGGNTDLDGVIGPINRYHETIFNFGKVPPRKVGIIGLEGTIIPIADQHFSGLDIVINASTMGMGEIEDSALKLDQLADRAVLFDMVYSPLETGLIRAAREQGLAVIGGLEMLIEQAASAFYHFFGQAAPRKFDTELSALLTV
jgi:shikimate dehydrogenase